MKKYALIVAGGSGTRMGSLMPKQFLLLAGKPVLYHTITAFVQAFADVQVILVLPAAHLQAGAEIAGTISTSFPIQYAKGGSTRFQSVQNGLAFVQEPSIVFVHDGVRCLVSSSLIQSCYSQATLKGSAIPAVAATDSIRMVEGDGHSIVDRSKVRIIQTPQTFQSQLLIKAFTQQETNQFTDEASVVEAAGEPVFLIEGDYDNIKITRPADLLVAETIMQQRSAF